MEGMLCMLLAFVSVVGATVGCTVSGNTGRCCWGTLVETCARLQCVTITDALQKLSYMESIINSTFYNGSVTVLFTEVTTAGLGSNSFTIPDVHDDSDTVWQRCMMLLISRPCIFVTNFTATADTCSGCIWRQTASSPNESSPFDYAEQFVGCFTLPDRRATAHTGTLSAQPSSETTPMSRDEPPTSLTNEQLSPSSTTSPTKYANDTTTSVIIAVVVVVVLLLVGIGLAVALFLYKKGNDLKKQHDEQQLSSQSTPQPATTTLASVLPSKSRSHSDKLSDISPEFESVRGPSPTVGAIAASSLSSSVSATATQSSFAAAATDYLAPSEGVVYDVVPPQANQIQTVVRKKSSSRRKHHAPQQRQN